VFYTDGLIERPDRDIDASLAILAELSDVHRDLPLREFVQALADNHPGGGHDDMAVLALRAPDVDGPHSPGAAQVRSR